MRDPWMDVTDFSVLTELGLIFGSPLTLVLSTAGERIQKLKDENAELRAKLGEVEARSTWLEGQLKGAYRRIG